LGVKITIVGPTVLIVAAAGTTMTTTAVWLIATTIVLAIATTILGFAFWHIYKIRYDMFTDISSVLRIVRIFILSMDGKESFMTHV
jgi:hypothetical protein